MIPLVLVTGFLGSGKTTLLQHLARRYRRRKIVWIVNEFSACDMDTARLAGEAADIVAIAGGSIFCRCKVTEFLELLRSLPGRFDPQAVVIEASGMADPLVAGKLLSESGLDKQYAIAKVVAVVDPGSLLKLLHTLPNIRAQIEAASWVLINKTDLHLPGRIAQAEAAVREINTAALLVRTKYAAMDEDPFGEPIRIATAGEVAPCVDPNFVKFEVALSDDLDMERLRQAVAALSDEIYRIKGFVKTGGRRFRLDYSVSGWSLDELPEGQPPKLVLIARGPCSDAVRQLVREWR